MRDANCHDHVGVGQGASVSVRVYESVVGVCIWLDSVHACRGGYFEMFNILDGHFRVFEIRRHFPSYSSFLLSVLALGPTVIRLRVYSCLNLGPETGRLQHV